MFIILKPDYFLFSSKVHYCRKTQIEFYRFNTFKPTWTYTDTPFETKEKMSENVTSSIDWMRTIVESNILSKLLFENILKYKIFVAESEIIENVEKKNLIYLTFRHVVFIFFQHLQHSFVFQHLLHNYRTFNTYCQGNNERKLNCSCVYSAYILKSVLSERNL